MTTTDSRKKIAEVRAQLEQLRADYHLGVEKDALTLGQAREIEQKIKGLNQQLAEIITVDADACPDCDAAPHGMVHEVLVRKKLTPIYEVGCLGCKDHRAQGFTPELAVEAWNAGPDSWLPASAEAAEG